MPLPVRIKFLTKLDEGEDPELVENGLKEYLEQKKDMDNIIAKFHEEIASRDLSDKDVDELTAGLERITSIEVLNEEIGSRRENLEKLLKKKRESDSVQRLLKSIELKLLKDGREDIYLSEANITENRELKFYNRTRHDLDSVKVTFAGKTIDYGLVKSRDSKTFPITFDKIPDKRTAPIHLVYDGSEVETEREVYFQIRERMPDIDEIERGVMYDWPELKQITYAVKSDRGRSLELRNDPRRMACLGRILDDDHWMEEYYFPIKAGNNYYLCGRTGSGKSYTMGVILEGLGLSATPGITDKRNIIPCVVIDVLDVFRDSIYPNNNEGEKESLDDWGLTPEALPNMKVFTIGKVPEGLKKANEKYSPTPFRFEINDLTVSDWIALLRTPNQNQIELVQVTVNNLKRRREETGINMGFEEVLDEIDMVAGTAHPGTREALRRHVLMLKEMDICAKEGTKLTDFIKKDQISVLSLQTSEVWVQDIVMTVLFKKLTGSALPLLRANPPQLPPFIVFIDELHKFFQEGYKTTGECLSDFIRTCRAAGSGMIMASQAPSDIPDDLLGQTNMIIAHGLDKEKDAKLLNSKTSTDLPPIFHKGRKRVLRDLKQGYCVVSDPNVGSFLLKVRPRISMHGGGTPDLFEKLDQMKD